MQGRQECFGIPRRQFSSPPELFLTGGTGGGSSNTQVIYFPTVSRNTLGQEVDLINNSAQATIVTARTAGVYSVSFMGCSSVGIAYGLITLNKAVGTSSGITHLDATVVASFIVDSTGTTSSCNVTLALYPGDFIQCQWGSGGSYNGLNSNLKLRIVKLT